MACYNHEILVQYLDDVYSLELLCLKIQGEMSHLNNEISRGKQIISNFNHTIMPTYEVEPDPHANDSPMWGIIFYGSFFLVGFLLFLIPVVGVLLGMCPIILGILAIHHDNEAGKYNDNARVQEAQINFEQRLAQYENLMKQARYYQSHLDSFTRSRDDAIIHLKTVKNNLAAAYGVNIIPNKYRDIYVAYYLYDYFSSSRETDLARFCKRCFLTKLSIN